MGKPNRELCEHNRPAAYCMECCKCDKTYCADGPFLNTGAPVDNEVWFVHLAGIPFPRVADTAETACLLCECDEDWISGPHKVMVAPRATAHTPGPPQRPLKDRVDG